MQNTMTRLMMTLIALTAASAHAATPEDVQRRSLTTFKQDVRPLLRKYCARCHGEKEQKRDVRFDQLNPDMVAGADGETWYDALNQLNKGEMPPKGKAQPTGAEREVLASWITAELKRAAGIRRSTGGHVVMRRLTQYEYQNTMSDLLGIEYDFTDGLPADEKSRDGFRNNGSTMEMTTAQLLHYMETARNGLRRALVTGERPRDMASKSIVSSNKTRLKLYPVTGNSTPKPKRQKKNVEPTETTTNPLKHTTDIQPGEFFPFREGVLRVRVKVRALNDDVQLLGIATGCEGDKVNELKPIGEVEFRGKEKMQEFVFDVQMENYPKPVYAVHKGAKVHLLVHAWDANQIPFEKTFGLYKEFPTSPNLVIESLEVEGPIVDQWPPKSHTQIFTPSPNENNEDVYAGEVISNFMRRAWRRPITKDELADTLAQFHASRDNLEFVPAVRETLASVLTSPNFLFLTEPVLDAKKNTPLGDHELATRLSCFLWSTMPDENLSRLADGGQLHDPNVLPRTVADMIKDDRAKNFVQHFALQWLNLDLVESIAVNPEYYPGYDLRITQDMRQETLLFFEEVLKKDLSILNFIDSDFTFLNRRLAKHYGIPFPEDEELGFVRVSLRDEPRRGGVLTHGSVHLVGSNGEDSHAIRRGAWVLDRLLASPPPPPPADVPQLDSSNPELANLSLKQQLALHVKNEACARCHKKIDPFGVAFEHYDATGAWRDAKIVLAKTELKVTDAKANRKKRAKNKPATSIKRTTVAVDATTMLHDGTAINGVPGLKAYLLTQKKDRFVEGFVRHLLTYALGRSLELGDRPTVEKLTTQFHKDGYKMSSLIESIVMSDLFQNK